MPSSTYSTASNDQCEHCHSAYTIIKKKKICAICRQYYCGNCAPRERYLNNSYRICLICQLISNNSTTNDQLLELKVKHLRNYLQAKDISHNTCTEKQELVDLIIRSRHLPFLRLLGQETESSSVTNNTNQEQNRSTLNQSSTSNNSSPSTSSMNSSKSGPFSNFQQTVSSFANQMNNFASNLQDYVTNTVSDVMNHTLGDEPQQTTTTSNNPNRGASSNYSFPSPGGSTHTTTQRPAPTNTQQQQRPSPSGSATASSNSTTSQRIRRKSLSEIKNEENIEDLNTRELKELLAANFVDFKGCVEKNELIDKVRRLYRDRQNEKNKAKELGDVTAGDSELCKICMDAIVDCVFLDCGHMVTCVKCGKLLAECPICRSNIVRVVRVFKS
ncbi:unnamed protein product [Rotaria sp. Silwood2]|nr:unnamed protein product [Rotaria sp. Silwood2]CAF2687633.1 unnamed protein product [Rotaria sp. Silwood2]CAF2912499.1 unnamed protein product [Rotaria sp. Silwood2]CAF4034938.1 unnamed protein product [Rotaria sp. Silwood2]CAF4536531.1 unnamed protein product [Rotaria sp. Silwood2]